MPKKFTLQITYSVWKHPNEITGKHGKVEISSPEEITTLQLWGMYHKLCADICDSIQKKYKRDKVFMVGITDITAADEKKKVKQ